MPIKIISSLYYCLDLIFLKPLSLAIVCLGVVSASANGGNLNDVITSLYRGDGVQLADPGGAFSHAAHFEDSALHELGELAVSAAKISYPYPNASGGTVYNFDPVLDDFVESESQHGLLYTVQAKTLGRGNIAFGLLYSQADYDRVDGGGLDSLTLELGHVDVGEPGSDLCIGGPAPECYLFEEDLVVLEVDLAIKTKQLFVYGAIGLSENFDLEFVLPMIENSISITSSAAVEENGTKIYFSPTLHKFDPEINGDMPLSKASASKTGIGDLKINAKWNFISSEAMSVASFVELTLPTGDYDNFMGQDHYTVKGSLLASNVFDLLDVPLQSHLNIGYKLLDGFDDSELSYAVAIEYDFTVQGQTITSAIELLGTQTLATESGSDDNKFDGAIGAIWSFREGQSLSMNYRFPINDDGLRASHMFSAGYAFSF
ncbi:hypothetical protein A9Q89_04635 [Gammaproteobacteria bacterium 53_120_T64]|nr:hypothetical protein A9Q89_04635 [Gammaproteobacteria bacterium 53_120_T64]